MKSWRAVPLVFAAILSVIILSVARSTHADELSSDLEQALFCAENDPTCIENSDDGTATIVRENPEANVAFTKSASLVVNENGILVPGSIDITLKANGPTVAVPADIFIVIVFDMSTSMGTNSSSKLANAKTGAVNFSEEILKPVHDDLIADAYLSVVRFGLNSMEATDFKTGLLSTARGGELDGSGMGMTNLQEAVAIAIDKLNSDEKSKNSPNKYVVVMSDGEPTACMGATKASPSEADSCTTSVAETLASSTTYYRSSGSNNNTRLTSTEFENAAIAVAEEGKSSEINFFTIGYEIASGSEAETTLKAIADSEAHYVHADVNDIMQTFVGAVSGVVSIAAGNNAVITDEIGVDFELVEALSGEVSISDDGRTVTCDQGKISLAAEGCTFRIRLAEEHITCHTFSVGDSFATNNDAELSFEKYKTITADDGSLKYTDELSGEIERISIDADDSPIYLWTGDANEYSPCPRGPEDPCEHDESISADSEECRELSDKNPNPSTPQTPKTGALEDQAATRTDDLFTAALVLGSLAALALLANHLTKKYF